MRPHHGGHALFEDRRADVAESDALGVLDDSAPWTVLGDDDHLLYAGHGGGLLLRGERDVAISRFMVVSPRLA